MARDNIFRMRLTDDERKTFQDEADGAGFRHVSEFIREAVRQAAESRALQKKLDE